MNLTDMDFWENFFIIKNPKLFGEFLLNREDIDLNLKENKQAISSLLNVPKSCLCLAKVSLTGGIMIGIKSKDGYPCPENFVSFYHVEGEGAQKIVGELYYIFKILDFYHYYNSKTGEVNGI